MKKTLVWALSLLVAGSITLISCGKYDEGPGLSLRSKKGRLAGDWMVEKATSTTGSTVTDMTSWFANYSINFEKDGKYSATFGSITDVGSWEFSDDKMMVISTNSSGGKDSMPIIRLTNKEFWTKEVNGNTTDEIHFMSNH